MVFLGMEGCANTYRKYQDDQLFHSELDYRVIGDIWVPVIFPGHDKVQKRLKMRFSFSTQTIHFRTN